MKCTSSEANKIVKKLEETIKDMLAVERKSSVFHLAMEEDIEAVRPEYDFDQWQTERAALKEKISIVKHAINKFNVSHDLPGFEGISIDQALIMLPQLKADKERLKELASNLQRETYIYQ